MRIRTCLLIVVAATLSGGSSALATVITPTGVTASTFYNNPPNVRAPGLTIDGSGLSPNSPWDFHTNDTVTTQTMWLSNFETNPTITWNLGQSYTLTGFHLWNYNEATGERGIAAADVQVSTDNINFTTILTQQAFTRASGSNSYVGEDYTLSATAQYVRFINTSTTIFSGNDGAFGLSEIRFVATPEPTALALFCCGAIGLCKIGRRRIVARIV